MNRAEAPRQPPERRAPRSTLVGAAFLVALRAISACAADPASGVSFIYQDRCIYVPARVNDTADLLFLVDTGANASAIDAAAASRLHLRLSGTTKVEGTAGVIATGTTRLASIAAGGHRAERLEVTVQDLGGLPAAAGTRVEGILGYDFLRDVAMRVDFAGRHIAFLEHPPREARADSTRWFGIPMALDHGIPRVEAALDDSIPCPLRIDTGASLFDTPDVYVNITTPTWERLRAADRAITPVDSLHATGTGGEFSLPVARVGRITIGAIRVESPFVIVQPPRGYFARADAVGFVSDNLLERFSPVILDYAGRRLYLFRRVSTP